MAAGVKLFLNFVLHIQPLQLFDVRPLKNLTVNLLFIIKNENRDSK